MKHFLLPCFCFFLVLTTSCHSNSHDDGSLLKNGYYPNDTSTQSGHVFIFNRKVLLKDFKSWYSYDYNNVKLSQNFIGLDKDSNKIDKRTFLNQLIDGGVVPFKTMIQDSLPVYKLYSLNTNDSDIQSTMQQAAQNEMFNYEMEGKQLPNYDFTDLNGNHYNKASTRGKTIVLKCWFINCVACVAEFPELNKLVDKYKNRNDILFISLARDAKNNLIDFLKKKPFGYAVVPEQQDYVEAQLKFYEFPTHVLIDKKGNILKVTNSISELIPFIKKQIGN